MQGLNLSLYGLNFALAFVLFLILNFKNYRSFVENLTIATYISIAVIVGARLGYIFIYEPLYYASNPLEIVELYKGGMSYHGSIIAIFIASFLLDKNKAFAILDSAVKVALISIPLGRICNFLNGELYGRVTDNSLLSVVFLNVDNNLRYPSQLIEAFFEGPILALILYTLYKRGKFKTDGLLCAYYALCYAILRFFAEFTREPDSFLGFVILKLNMGQILCLIQAILALGLIYYLKNKALRS